MDFVAIDFETATSMWTSICSMGICVIENNTVKERKEILIKPDPYEFSDYNIKIHGITPKMVKDRLNFDGYWDEIKPYIDNKLVIAHNTSFDVNVLRRTLDKFGLEYPRFEYMCTVKLSQKAYPQFESHKLNRLCEELGIDFSHHHAAEDAYACAMVMLNIADQFGLDSAEKIEKCFGVKRGRLYPGCKDVRTRKRKVDAL